LGDGGGDVLGHVDQHRTRPPRGGDEEGFFHRRREITDVLDQEIVLDAGPRDADGVDLLECVVADDRRRHLAREHHHRDGVHVGGGDPGNRVGHPGTGSHQDHAGLAGGAGIAVGGMRGALRVTYQHVLYDILLVKGVVNMQRCAAGIAEDILYNIVLQATDQYVSTVQSHASPLVFGKKRPAGVGRVERVSINATSGRGKFPGGSRPAARAGRPGAEGAPSTRTEQQTSPCPPTIHTASFSAPGNGRSSSPTCISDPPTPRSRGGSRDSSTASATSAMPCSFSGTCSSTGSAMTLPGASDTSARSTFWPDSSSMPAAAAT